MVESKPQQIDGGVIEAASGMGATNWQIVTRVLLIESVPSLLRACPSAPSPSGLHRHHRRGGRGGLGNIAFRFGYQRYWDNVMYVTVLLILLVCVIQSIFQPAGRKGRQAAADPLCIKSPSSREAYGPGPARL